VLKDGNKMPGAQWFPEARLNFSENLLRRRDDADAIVFWGEDQVRRRLSYHELYDDVSRVAQALRAAGLTARHSIPQRGCCSTMPTKSG
jgi:acetoacetyl-CoA synthetase